MLGAAHEAAANLGGQDSDKRACKALRLEMGERNFL